jgi:hypothetical protein
MAEVRCNGVLKASKQNARVFDERQKSELAEMSVLVSLVNGHFGEFLESERVGRTASNGSKSSIGTNEFKQSGHQNFSVSRQNDDSLIDD